MKNIVYAVICTKDLLSNTLYEWNWGNVTATAVIPINVDDVTESVFNCTPLSELFEFQQLGAKIERIYLTPYIPNVDVINDTFTITVGTSSFTITALRPTSTPSIINKSPIFKEIKGFNNKKTNIAMSVNNDRDIKYESKLYESPYHFYNIVVGSGTGNIQINTEDIQESGDLTIVIDSSLSLSGNNITVSVKQDSLKNDPRSLVNKIVYQSASELPIVSDAFTERVSNGLASFLGNGLMQTLSSLNTISTASVMSAFEPLLVQATDSTFAPKKLISTQNDAIAEFSNRNYGGLVRVFENSLPPEVKKRVFDYFTKYGYNVGEVEKPNLRSRYWYNYIKTKDVQVQGIECNDEKIKFQEILNNGTTIWHYRNGTVKNYGDYSKENCEMSLIGG